MMKTRKPRTKRAVLAAAVTMSLLLAACSGDGGSDANGTDGQSQSEIRFSWWGSGHRHEKTEAVIDLFMAEHPEISVIGEPSEYGNHFERLTVQSAAGGAPCVPQQQSSRIGEYAERGHLIDLQPFIDDGTIDVSGVPETVLDSGTYENTRYMIPTGIFFEAGVYNQTVLEEIGLEAPVDSWTWDEWEEWLRSAAPLLPGGMAATDLALGGSLVFFGAYALGHGQALYDSDGLGFDAELVEEWLAMWQSFVQDGISTTPEQMAARGVSHVENPVTVGQVLWTAAADNAFQQMNAVSVPSGVGTLMIVKLPNGPAGGGDTVGANGLSISSSCPEQDRAAAATFLDFFLNNPEAAAIYASDNGTVSNDELRQAQIDDPETNPDIVQQMEMLDLVFAEYDPVSYVAPPGATEVTDIFRRGAEAVWLGQSTPAEAAQMIVEQAELAL